MVKFRERQLNMIFRALADPSRRKLVGSLANGEMTLGNLAAPLKMSMPGVMKHVGILEDCGLVVTEKRGRVRYCRLEADPLGLAEEWIDGVRAFWSGSLGRLQKHLEEQ